MDNRKVVASALSKAFENSNFDDWANREKNIAVLIETVFDAWILGGDILRPTLLASKDGIEYFAFIEHPKLGMSKFAKNYIDKFSCQSSFLLSEKKIVVCYGSTPQVLNNTYNRPTVTLTNLIDIQRYPRIRMPLNIARLAQWIRFWHYGSCIALDAPIDFCSNIEAQAEAIVKANSDILGISIGFGETDRLFMLLEAIKKTSYRPLLVLGNIGASLAEETLRQFITGFDSIKFCKGYGEYYLLDLIREWRYENYIEIPAINPPDILIIPDERLIVETINKHGQLSFESSFGCHYSKCSFCPRSLKGANWSKDIDNGESAAVLIQEIFTNIRHNSDMDSCKVLALTDEDFFGKTDVVNYSERSKLLAQLSTIAHDKGFQLEIYTRVDQLFSEKLSASRNEYRILSLQKAQPQLKRVFIGVESGSESQLARYTKGQTVRDVILALRVGSLIRLPLEFGFITFDPMMTVDELIENLLFLARTDIMLRPFDFQQEPHTVVHCAFFPNSENYSHPLFFYVAYMATELEVLRDSQYYIKSSNEFKPLILGFDLSFFRFNMKYKSSLIEKILGICRVWTEGTFTQIYDHRLKSRTTINNLDNVHNSLLGRYRLATYMIMLLSLTNELDYINTDLNDIISNIQQNYDWPYSKLSAEKLSVSLSKIWQWVDCEREYICQIPNFDERFRWGRRRN